MTGRIPVLDVQPVIRAAPTRRRASSASRSRCRRPSSARATTRCEPPPCSRAPDGTAAHPRAHGARCPGHATAGTPPSPPTRWASGRSRCEGWGDPYGTWRPRRRDQGAGRHRRRPDARRGCRAAHPRPRGHVRPQHAAERARAGRRRQRRVGDTAAARTTSSRAALGQDVVEVLERFPVRDLVTADRREYPLVVERARALVRLLVRVLPALGGRGAQQGRLLALRHLRDGRRAAARGRRHGLRRRLPHADPPDRTSEPQGPQQHADPGPGRPGRRRTRSARPRAATTRSTPTWARSTTSTPSSLGPATSAWRSRSTSRCSARRTTRGSPSTRSGSPPGPTARSRTRRTRRRSTRTSTRSTSTTTPRASTPRSDGSCRCGSTTAYESSASTTRTPSR